MRDDQREVECITPSSATLRVVRGMQQKIIEISTCLLLLPLYGRVLCFLSFANRKPNMNKLG